jgi:uncharacterized repeat protein (TIGR03803 family)
MNNADEYATRKNVQNKPLIAVARDTVQTAEDARAISVKKMDDQRIANNLQNSANAQAQSRAQADDATRQKEQAQADAAKAQSDMAASQATSAAAVRAAQADADRSVYGTTEAGGVYNDGTVFRLTPSKDGKWRETLLHSFVDNGKDGNSPDAGLIFDIAGNLYGTTAGGGGGACTGGCGAVFELVRDGNGGWTEKVLHRFSHGHGKDGYYPTANLILDAKGDLYGTTNGGGSFGEGTVFRLTHRANGEWTEKVLHSFDWNGKDGYYPDASLIFDASGNLYGTTSLGGTGQCTLIGIIVGCGTVFRLMPDANGRWNETILHNFQSNGKDGTEPNAGLALDGAGNLYGTTVMGGSDLCSDDGCGTVFEITP